MKTIFSIIYEQYICTMRPLKLEKQAETNYN